MADGVVGVDDAAAGLGVEAGEDVADVVGEEALPVEHGGDHLRVRLGCHEVAAVREGVHLAPVVR